MIQIKNRKFKEKKSFKATLILLALVIGFPIIYTTPYGKAAEDNYEENDIYLEAYDIDSNAGQWLSEIDGPGYQNDHDWYSFDLTHGRLIVYYSGSINIQISKQSDPFNYLYDKNDFTNKILDVNVDTGIVWLIKITGSNEGNSYNIYWDDITGTWEDHYENNDDYSTAYDLSSYENTYLSGIDSLGVNFDDDWFKFTADPYNLHVQIDLKSNYGYFDLYLYDTDGTTMLDDESWSTNMQIDYYLSCPGTYFIKLSGDYSHYVYDLRWHELPYLWDDDYEQNDIQSYAYYLAYTTLSDDQGPGKQSDDDWYQIHISPPNLILDIDCTFTHAEGDINIQLYNDGLLAESASTTNNEHIDYELDHLVSYGNNYYIKVYGDNNMNDYDLHWSTSPPSDDNYEENDNFNEVYDFSAYENTWLSNIDGEAINLDQDWYRIHVDPEEREIEINCSFIDNYGNIELALYDDSESLLKESKSITDNEIINYVVPSGGSYYIKVFQNPQYTFYPNRYDLKWRDYMPIEDNYEENDDLGSSYDLSLNESVWLSDINGTGRQLDQDWYKIYLPSGVYDLQIECLFSDSLGDIDIALYDASETYITGSSSYSDDEFVDFIISGGKYYHILIYGKTTNSGNEYNLKWDIDTPSDDNYEENDIIGNSYDFSAYNSTWLHDVDGHGRQIDDDWYKISVPSDAPYLEIECTFTDADGNIDIGLYHPNGTQIAVSTSNDNNEFMTEYISIPGFYYVKVFGLNWGNEYDLKWTTGLDNTPPIWLGSISDQQIEYGTDFNYDVDAWDPSGIKEYQVNDTINFLIDSEGLIENKISLEIGIYWLEITATDNFDNQNSANIRIAVHAAFLKVTINVNASEVDSGEFISFTCSVLDEIPPCTFHWDFDDGATRYEQNPVYAFYSDGIFNVTLTVTDQFGVIGTQNILIYVGEQQSEPETRGIPGFNVIILVSILGIISIISALKKKSKF